MAVFSPLEIELPLSTIQLHYDGWLMLPAEARQHLDVATGDRLDIELTDDGLLLRSAKQAKETVALEPMAAVTPPAAAPVEASAPVEVETAVAKRGPGRPRKAMTPEPVPGGKGGGRRKSKPAGTA